MFTYDCMEQKCLMPWSRVAFSRSSLLSSNMLRTADFGIREDPVSTRAASPSSYPKVLRTALKLTSSQKPAVKWCPDERPGVQKPGDPEQTGQLEHTIRVYLLSPLLVERSKDVTTHQHGGVPQRHY